MTWTLERILKGARKHGASDIHLVRGVSPVFRINGEIRASEGTALDEQAIWNLLQEMLNEFQLAKFKEEWSLCFSKHWEGVGRFRAAVYFHAMCPEVAIRLCEEDIRSCEELGLPPVIEELTRKPSGLVLVTGPTGVGKTTTLNVMVDSINQERRAKIITIEDPVEYVHSNARSIIVQQEVLTDVKSFNTALINSLRQDPDVIVIGEMRTLETIETALVAAETGHLVLATLHTPDAVQTIQRIQSVFPEARQNFINIQIANCLQAIIAQKLLPRADGKGRVLACEVCVATHAVRNKIRERNLHQIYSDIQAGKRHSMQTIDSSLLELYQRGDITYDTAISNAHDPSLLRHQLE